MNKLISSIVNGVKESIRKLLVNLKRNPQFIPLAMALVAFLVYSFNLTYIQQYYQY